MTQKDFGVFSAIYDFNNVFTYVHSLRRHVKAINKLADAGMFFWDYGNAFLLEAQRAGQ